MVLAVVVEVPGEVVPEAVEVVLEAQVLGAAVFPVAGHSEAEAHGSAHPA